MNQLEIPQIGMIYIFSTKFILFLFGVYLLILFLYSSQKSIWAQAFIKLFTQLWALVKHKGYSCLLAAVIMYTGAEITVGGWISEVLIEYLLFFI